MKKGLKLFAVILLALLLVACGKKENKKEKADDSYDIKKAEVIDLEYISNLRAQTEDNQHAAKEYDGKLVKIELDIDSIYDYGFQDSYTYKAQRSSGIDSLPVVLKDSSVLKNYKLDDKVTVVGKLVVSGTINYGKGQSYLAYKVMVDKAEIVK